MKIIEHPSPNFGPRRGTDRPDMVVLHYTAMESAEAACARLCDPEPEVSAHYLISDTGKILRLVAEEQRAWHAGVGAWQDCKDINSYSIGIELANRGDEPFPEPQLCALETLLKDLLNRWQINPNRVLGHSDIAPGRKQDPGQRFPWSRLAAQGLAAITPKGSQCDPNPETFLTAAQTAGYTAQIEGNPADVLLNAIRLRHRPEALGKPLDGRDVAIVLGLG